MYTLWALRCESQFLNKSFDGRLVQVYFVSHVFRLFFMKFPEESPTRALWQGRCYNSATLSFAASFREWYTRRVEPEVKLSWFFMKFTATCNRVLMSCTTVDFRYLQWRLQNSIFFASRKIRKRRLMSVRTAWTGLKRGEVYTFNSIPKKHCTAFSPGCTNHCPSSHQLDNRVKVVEPRHRAVRPRTTAPGPHLADMSTPHWQSKRTRHFIEKPEKAKGIWRYSRRKRNVLHSVWGDPCTTNSFLNVREAARCLGPCACWWGAINGEKMILKDAKKLMLWLKYRSWSMDGDAACRKIIVVKLFWFCSNFFLPKGCTPPKFSRGSQKSNLLRTFCKKNSLLHSYGFIAFTTCDGGALINSQQFCAYSKCTSSAFSASSPKLQKRGFLALFPIAKNMWKRWKWTFVIEAVVTLVCSYSATAGSI